MPRGRKPKPTHLKLIEGNRGRRSLNAGEPEYDLSNIMPPSELDDQAKVEWGRVAHQLLAQGVLTDVDRATLAGYCACYSTFITAEKALAKMSASGGKLGGMVVMTARGGVTKNPLIRIRQQSMELMLKLASEMGMTPTARTRLGIDASGRAGTTKYDF